MCEFWQVFRYITLLLEDSYHVNEGRKLIRKVGVNLVTEMES